MVFTDARTNGLRPMMGRQQMQPIPCNVKDITTTITNTALGAAGQRDGAKMGTATFLKTMLQKAGCPHFALCRRLQPIPPTVLQMGTATFLHVEQSPFRPGKVAVPISIQSQETECPGATTPVIVSEA